MSIAGTRQTAHIPVQARVATSCRHTVPAMDTPLILLQSAVIGLKLSRYPMFEWVQVLEQVARVSSREASDTAVTVFLSGLTALDQAFRRGVESR